MPLTDTQIQALKPVASKTVEMLDDGKGSVVGLRLRVGASGTKSFVLRTRVGAKMKVLTLGRYGSRFGLADARKAARRTLADFEAGRDPSKVQKHKSGSHHDTLANLYQTWCRQHVNALRSAKDVKRIFESYILPTLGDRLVVAIERKDVVQLVDDVAFANPEKPTPIMARAVFAQLSSFFGWCAGRDIIAINPCMGVNKPSAGVARERVLNYIEISKLWRAADQEGWPFGGAVKILLLTGARRSEVFGACWSEFDFNERLWTLPAKRAKNGKQHFVPLSALAISLLKELPRLNDNELLFPACNGSGNPASGISKVKRRFDVAIGCDDWVLHDIRRTVATELQKLDVRLEVVEAILNHIAGSRAGIVGIYQRHSWSKEKRQALEDWASELQNIIAVK